MMVYTTLILAVATASLTSEVRAAAASAAEEPSVSSPFLMSELEAPVMTDDGDQQRELFKTTKSIKKSLKDSQHYYQSLCNILLFEDKNDSQEEEEHQCLVGKPNQFIGGAFNAKAAIAYNKRTGNCELMYTDLPTNPCDVHPQSLGGFLLLKL